MKTLIRRCLLVAGLSVALGILPSVDRSVQACPGCKTANETESLRPRAYMLSILFMLGMPATVFAGFGVAFYRMSRKSMPDQATLDAYLQQQAETRNRAEGSVQDVDGKD